MSEPAPRELCEKLAAMGCKTESQMLWRKEVGLFFLLRIEWKNDDDVPAFFQNDFTGATEQADENCKKAFGEQTHDDSFGKSRCPYCKAEMRLDAEDGRDYCWLYLKRQMIECHRINYHHNKAEKWWQYIERTMRE